MQAQEMKFNFKARQFKDENDKVIGKGKKQPSITAMLMLATKEDVSKLLQVPDVEVLDKEGKSQEPAQFKYAKPVAMVVDAVNELIRQQARDQFDEIIEGFGQDLTQTVDVSMLDHDKLTLEYIANLPPAQRGARAIPEEDWVAMYDDYLVVMVAATGKSQDKIKNHLDIFKKPTRIKNNKDVLAVLIDQLDVYTSTSKNIEETADCVQRIRNKFDKWLKEEDKVDLDAL